MLPNALCRLLGPFAAMTCRAALLVTPLITLCHAHDSETITLRGYEAQVWADARLLPRPQQQQPLWLPALVNDSGTATQTPDADDDHADADRAGVPLTVLDGLLEAQLHGSGRFALIDAAPADVVQAPAQLQVRVLRYQPPHRRAGADNLWNRSLNQWQQWFDDDPQPLGVSLVADWRAADASEHRRLTIHVDSDTCLQLPHAVASAGDPEPVPYSEQYRRSAIGQASLAAINRLLAWLDARYPQDQQQLTITSVRGTRLTVQDPLGLLRGGETLTLFHRDSPARAIGSIRIATPQSGHSAATANMTVHEAWPLTLATGSVRPGDVIWAQQAARSASILPASMPAGSRCRAAPPAVVEGDHQTAPSAEPASAAAEDDLPQS